MRKWRVVWILVVVLLVGCGVVTDGRNDDSSIVASIVKESVPSVSSSSEIVNVGRQTRNADECEFINGPGGTEKATLKVGDTFLGLTMVDLFVQMETDPETGEEYVAYVTAYFEGEVVVQGILFRDYYDGLSLIVDVECEALLPCIQTEAPGTAFKIANEEQVDMWLEELGFEVSESEGGRDGPEGLRCELLINQYTYVVADAGVADNATVVEMRNPAWVEG